MSASLPFNPAPNPADRTGRARAAAPRGGIHRRRLAWLAAPALIAALLATASPVHAAKARKLAEKAAAAAAPGPEGSGVDAFRIIIDRNIFNPNRVSRSRGTPEEQPTRIDMIALVGTLLSDTGAIAFFDSPDPRYRKNLHEGEILAGMTIKQITPQGVQFTQQEKALTVRVSEQLRRAEGGEWRVSSRDGGRPEVARPIESYGMPAIPPGASEVLRRLMEQRQKQLKQ